VIANETTRMNIEVINTGQARFFAVAGNVGCSIYFIG
jgi:hypothetical protein